MLQGVSFSHGLCWRGCRFNTRHREYTYFVIQHGQLDIAAMQEAASHFVGEHDFRNFCKIDAEHVKNFVRTILDFRVKLVQPPSSDGRARYALHIKGTAFLWHQVSLTLTANTGLALQNLNMSNCGYVEHVHLLMHVLLGRPLSASHQVNYATPHVLFAWFLSWVPTKSALCILDALYQA